MTSRSYFGKMNSTLGSVVPLAMFILGLFIPFNSSLQRDQGNYLLCGRGCGSKFKNMAPLQRHEQVCTFNNLRRNIFETEASSKENKCGASNTREEYLTTLTDASLTDETESLDNVEKKKGLRLKKCASLLQ